MFYFELFWRADDGELEVVWNNRHVHIWGRSWKPFILDCDSLFNSNFLLEKEVLSVWNLIHHITNISTHCWGGFLLHLNYFQSRLFPILWCESCEKCSFLGQELFLIIQGAQKPFISHHLSSLLHCCTILRCFMLISKNIQTSGKTRSNALVSGCMLKHRSDSENWNAVYYGRNDGNNPMEIKDEKEEYPWALWRQRIRSEGGWCILQMWTFLGATAAQKCRGTQRNQLESIPAHSAQISHGKYQDTWVHFLNLYLSPFLSELCAVFRLNVCILWQLLLQWMFHLAFRCQESNQRGRRGSQSLTYGWVSGAHNSVWERRLPNSVTQGLTFSIFRGVTVQEHHCAKCWAPG